MPPVLLFKLPPRPCVHNFARLFSTLPKKKAAPVPKINKNCIRYVGRKRPLVAGPGNGTDDGAGAAKFNKNFFDSVENGDDGI